MDSGCRYNFPKSDGRPHVEIDRGFWTGNATQFLARIHFRDAGDEKYREVLRDFILAEAEFRRAAAQSYGEEQFGLFETLNVILSRRNRPVDFGVHGNRAAGAFSRGRGIELVRINGIWKWDFFDGFATSRLDRIPEATTRLRDLTRRVAAGASAAEVWPELRGL